MLKEAPKDYFRFPDSSLRAEVVYSRGVQQLQQKLLANEGPFELSIRNSKREEFFGILDSQKLLADRRVLVLGAHPDDEGISGGLSSILADLGVGVSVVSLTKGDARKLDDYNSNQLIKARREEGLASAEILGAGSFINLGFDDLHLKRSLPDAEDSLVQVLRILRPDIIITLHPDDEHPDHRLLAQLAYDASARAVNTSSRDEINGL